MPNHDCVIGIRYYYEETDLVTLDWLKKHIEETASFNKRVKEDGVYGDWILRREWSLKDYCDKRKDTDLSRFDYCPYCGKKIEWNKIKEDDDDT